MEIDAGLIESSLRVIEYCENYNPKISDSIDIPDTRINVKTFNLCLELGLIKEGSDSYEVTRTGLQVIEIDDVERSIRHLLDMLIEKGFLEWSAHLAQGPDKFREMYGDTDEWQILQWSGLTDNDDTDTVLWWYGQRDHNRDRESKIETGEAGERKTIEYEKLRIGKKPEWVAYKHGDQYGYDVLSWCEAPKEPVPKGNLKIESKASIQKLENAYFFITRYEWDTAEQTQSEQEAFAV